MQLELGLPVTDLKELLNNLKSTPKNVKIDIVRGEISPRIVISSPTPNEALSY